MDFAYADAFGESAAPAYETLLLDVMIGEATLFTRSDEVEAAWRVVDPVLAGMPPPGAYAPGTWGPREAVRVVAEPDGWHNPTLDGGTP
jgi:glucose-6-phosphate 1-dehydrogenase